MKWGVQQRGPLVVLLVISLVVGALSLASIRSSNAALLGETFAPSVVALIWLTAYIWTSYRAFSTIYLFTTAYVVCLFLFHLGLFIQDGLGLVKLLAWQDDMGPWAVRAGWYTNLALACVGIGFPAQGLAYKPRKLSSPAAANAMVPQHLAWLQDQGVGLLIASLILLAGAVATSGNILALTRLQLFHLSDTRFISVFSMLAPSAAIALLVAARTPRQRLLSYVVGFVVLLLFLVSGQRSTALFPLIAAAVVWTKVGRRINPVLASAAVLGTLLIIPVVGYLRTLGTYGDIASANAIERAADYANISAAFAEMGGSIGPLMYTLKLIPEEEPFRYGSSYLAYFTDAIPNVGLRPDAKHSRVEAEELLRNGATEEALLAMNPGDWASFHIIRDQFARGGGAGYSGVAEPYFNFGTAGVLVFFVAIGVFLCRIDCLPIILHRNWLAFGATIFWHLLPSVRNGFGIFLKPAEFIVIALLIWMLVRRFVPRRQIAGTPKLTASQKSPDSPPRTPDRADPRRPVDTPPHRSPPRA